MTPAVPAHLAMNAPLAEREPGMSDRTVDGALLAKAQYFVDCKYVARADSRQKAMGLAYVEAERQDLAKEIASFTEGALREAMKGATIIANQSGALLREKDDRIAALHQVLREILGYCDENLGPSRSSLLSKIAACCNANLAKGAS